MGNIAPRLFRFNHPIIYQLMPHTPTNILSFLVSTEIPTPAVQLKDVVDAYHDPARLFPLS